MTLVDLDRRRSPRAVEVPTEDWRLLYQMVSRIEAEQARQAEHLLRQDDERREVLNRLEQVLSAQSIATPRLAAIAERIVLLEKGAAAVAFAGGMQRGMHAGGRMIVRVLMVVVGAAATGWITGWTGWLAGVMGWHWRGH